MFENTGKRVAKNSFLKTHSWNKSPPCQVMATFSLIAMMYCFSIKWGHKNQGCHRLTAL